MAVRERLHLSQVELARRAGLTRQAVNMIERGLSVPSINTALRLAEVLNFPVTELFQKPEPDQTIPVILPSGRNFRKTACGWRRWAVDGSLFPFIPQRSAKFGEADGRLVSRHGQQGSVQLLTAPSNSVITYW